MNFIDHEYIYELLKRAENASEAQLEVALVKAEKGEALEPYDIALLLNVKDDKVSRMFKVANDIKNRIYGKRVVIFAPLYISNYCVNNCKYCGYKCGSGIARRKLTYEEIQDEVRALEKMGHKRLALEVGEDPVNCPIDYVLDALDAIYETKLDNGSIRRVNVNIAATTVQNYKKLHEKGIGTYILFQETYHKPTYEDMHPKCLKGNYEYHLTAFDRAMEGGIDDVGAGVLFGLYDYKFEVLGLMLHNKHLEDTHGVGFHTISVPRLKKAEGMDLEQFPYLLDDFTFKKIVAILRIAVPFTGIIMSTRESEEMRREVLKYGVSQVSAGSCTGVGGYNEETGACDTAQFEVSDERTPTEVLSSLIDDGYIPSYCTACYRQGRTGDRFMSLAKTGNIHNVCTPNALMTLMEYITDYGNKELYDKAINLINFEADQIVRPDIKELTKTNIEKIKNGERDLYI